MRAVGDQLIRNVSQVGSKLRSARPSSVGLTGLVFGVALVELNEGSGPLVARQVGVAVPSDSVGFVAVGIGTGEEVLVAGE